LSKLQSIPSFVTPMAAHTIAKLPEGGEWLYELKLDGYRALLIKNGKQIEIRSRNDKDLTRMYPTVTAAGLRLKAEQVILDGEIVALDTAGRPSFQALQHRLGRVFRSVRPSYVHRLRPEILGTRLSPERGR
jgi:bifunctional non-homologous end joining protein LigD